MTIDSIALGVGKGRLLQPYYILDIGFQLMAK